MIFLAKSSKMSEGGGGLGPCTAVLLQPTANAAHGHCGAAHENSLNRLLLFSAFMEFSSRVLHCRMRHDGSSSYSHVIATNGWIVHCWTMTVRRSSNVLFLLLQSKRCGSRQQPNCWACWWTAGRTRTPTCRTTRISCGSASANGRVQITTTTIIKLLLPQIFTIYHYYYTHGPSRRIIIIVIK